jgi:ribosomal protein S18 acetylase RimI-like enzyme
LLRGPCGSNFDELGGGAVMELDLMLAPLQLRFWFGRKQYSIFKANTTDIIDTKLIDPEIEFDYECISRLDTRTLSLFGRVDSELSEFVSASSRKRIRKALRFGSVLVTARDSRSGEVAACLVCYVGPAERDVLALRDSELYISQSFTRPEYRGMGLQARTLQRGLTWMQGYGGIKGTAVAIIDPSNTASMRGLAKVGFAETGWLVEQRILWCIRISKGCDDGLRFCRLVFGRPM